MPRGLRTALVLTLLVAGANVPLAAQTSDASDVVRLIAVTYADGRTTKTPLRDNTWDSWTPAFPRIAGASTVADGLPLQALQFEYVKDGRVLFVTVSLLYGTVHQKRVRVAEVRLTDEHPVYVDQLPAFGVQPITLAIVSAPRPQLLIPTVTVPSSQLETAVEIPTSGAPRYLVSITNHAQQAVMGLAFQAYRGETLSIRGKPHKPGFEPLIAPGQTYVLTLTVSLKPTLGALPDDWAALDRIDINSVTWSDAIVEGKERPAIETQIVNDGTARQLERVLTLLRSARAAEAIDLVQLRAAVAALTIDDPDAVKIATADPNRVTKATARSLTRIGMENAKDALLTDLDAFLADPASRDPRTQTLWLESTVAKFDGWRTRIVSAAR
jgi:hypothetical protein